MPTSERIKQSFEKHHIEYGITNPNGKDLARIDFFSGEVKVGQALFGDAIAPGSFASLIQDEIHLFFPLIHFANILSLIQTHGDLSLFIDREAESGDVERGGMIN